MTPAPESPQAESAGPEPEREAPLDEAVRRRRERLTHWEKEGERSLGRNLAMVGALGWIVVAPTLLGIFAGRWLDRTFAMGVFWTLGLLVLGLALGCWMAWKRIHRE
ncbi:MAG TPA: AtpZ/AtpI family protein [Candidatus Binatia bacterium]|nr:AtpZ/AtpI family protein [Candidatus Binatia bacterium]